jgi:hemoglobin
MSDWEDLGGEAAVRGHLLAFLGRMSTDFIVGFLFEGRDLARLADLELGHVARILGGPVPYAGRPLAVAHRPLRINRGQFRRRLALLRTVLRERGVADDVIGRWVDHDRRFEAAICDGTDCGPPG